MENMPGVCGCSSRKSRRKYHIKSYGPPVVILLLQFFFKFAQGQGPGNVFSVSENRSPGTLVGTIQTDTTYTYTFGDSSNAKNYFNLDPNTGRITTKVQIDRESLNLQENKFTFLVLGQNSKSTNVPFEVSIEILDENDNKPTFPNQSEAIRFREHSQIGSQQFAPSASDIDYGNNSVISQYKIISGNGPFTIYYDRGLYGDVPIIQTTGELDREKISSYTLTIQAIDSGKPPQSGTTVIQVIIEDINDHAPEFVPSEHYAQVNETDPVGTYVIRVSATDLDAGVNQDINYEIENTNDGSDQFRIESNTGEIFTTTQPLYCAEGQCTLIIKAHDNGIPSYSGRAFVYITVIDTNNHDPVIRFKYVPAGNEFSSVNEDAKDGDTVAGVTVSDPDVGSTPTVRIIAGNELQHFRLVLYTPGQYLVIVNGDSVLDRERHYIYNITFEARDSGNPPRTSTNSLVIYINDINDHAPVFTNKKVKLSISETTEVGSFIASMLATDLDSGINAKLTYNIDRGNDPEWFFINKDTGLVTTMSRLHYEEQNYFKMNISVRDGALHSLKDYAELEITIWDENDIAPTFSQTVFNVSLEENLGNVLPVVSASAADRDSGLNGSLVYYFHPHVELLYPGTFYINADTGDVTTKKSLDREEIANYTIRILAKDKGPAPLTSTATVYLRVLDVNDNTPIFYPKSYYAKVSQGQGQGTFVVKVTATDPDEGDNGKIIYSFSSSDFGKFTIDSASGTITTTGVLQKDIKSSYLLNVIAKDKVGSRQDTATVQVSVIAPTDLQPYFTSISYQFSIPEDSGISSPQYVGVNVGKVTAKSDSALSSIVYRIVSGDASSLFTIDMATGLIRRNKAIDREVHPVYKLIVVATVADMYAETEVIITVTDSNDNAPKFEFPYLELDIFENWPVGHEIARISASDPDEDGPNSRISYSLQRDANNMFGIQPSTGLLYLNKPLWLLGANSVTLTVVAMDAGTPTYTASQELRLQVQDVNNHTPGFAHTTFELSLVENYAVNFRFFNVVAVDKDLGENGRITYNISRGNEDGKFGIFPGGYMYIAKELDRETKDLYKLSVVATDHGTQPRSSECNITIHITDYNDNKPIFLNASYSFSIMENKPAGVLISYIRASDADVGRNGEVSYAFKTTQSDFLLDSQNGAITSLKVFDREVLAASDFIVVFDVLVRDNGLKRLEDVATVRVKILDENDNAPVFKRPVYKVAKFENEPRFSNVTVVKADDADDGINKIVTYSIIAGNEDGHFKIDPTTGQITLDKQLDRETEDFYELSILAVDSGEKVRYNTTCKVQITVNDINDNFPLFAQSQMDISIREDVKPGSEVAHFLATDIDIGVNAEVTYLLSGTDNDGAFGIDRHTGKIYLLKPLDYETKKNYKLNVTAKDNGVPSLTYYIRFSISIEDVNDNAPVFQNQPLVFSIIENSSGSVTTIQARDADSGKNGEVQYSIAYQDPPGTNFKIVKNNGQIYIDKQIDREMASVFKLTVVATDQAEAESQRLSTETVVTINIEDVNDNEPVVTSFNAIAVPYSTPRNEYITTITVTDKDTGNNGKFAMQLLQTGPSHFSLDSNLGRLHLTSPFQDQSVRVYPVTIQTNDYGIPNQLTSSANIAIIISNNSNSGPLFQSSSYNGKVEENSAVGKSILRVQALSRQNSAVEYYITNITRVDTGVQAERYFQVDKTSGVVSTAFILDREVVGDKFNVEIYAIDITGSQLSTSVTMAQIELLDVNDTPPRFSQNYYTVSVDENVRLDFPVFRVAVYDDDSLGGLQLTLNAGSDVNLKIKQDGTIVTTGPLDRETTAQYTLQVTATDGIQSSSCMVRINLRDINDNAPKFPQSFYSFDIDEDTLIDTTVGSVRANDPDQGLNGQVTYTLKAGWGNDTFSLDPVKGTFTLLRLLDFEENQLYTVEVNAQDQGDPAKTSSVLVYFNVKDTNDNTPLFEHGTYDAAVYENITIGTSVVQVIAFDVDSGVNGEVTYSIIDGDYGGQFRINQSGVIFTVSKLDRETIANYTLVIKATDRAVNVDKRRTATAKVVLSILDINDYTPVIIAPSILHVCENSNRSTVVHTFQVRDLDEGLNGQVEFDMVSQVGGAFNIGSKDGKLRVQTDLDRETVQNYSMIIGVRDLGKPSLTAIQKILVVVDDKNDHSPVFSPESYDKEVQEDVQIGTTLLQVSATDLDFGLNAIVKFFIISGDDNNDFNLDQSSGVLRVQKNLDYERVKAYSLVIQAEDSGDDVRYSTATVSVTVLDVNDNVPLFVDSPFVGFVRENQNVLSVYVLHVSATDEDSPPFNQLQYAIRGDNGDLFRMNSTTGEILALKTLDREAISQYTLTVVATDSATGRGLTGSGTVSVFVEDVNDNPPVFDRIGSYMASVTENADPDTEVIIVKATDQDEGSNAQIIYQLKDNIGDKFTIYPDTGRITTRVRLNREEVSQYTLEVIAMDTSLVPLSANTTVIVYINDVNDNAPQFNSDSYIRNMQLPVNIGTFVLGVTASDLDSGNNRLVEYSISQGDSGYFIIDNKTGVITARQVLTSVVSYTFKVTAKDKGSPPLNSTVPVTVTVASSSGVTLPTFDPVVKGLRVVENLALQQNVTKVKATSANNAVVMYSIAGGNMGDAFGVESSSGRIYVANTIDYELIQEYHLWIKATESGSGQVSSYVEVVIGVDDVNDNEPRFSKLLYSVTVPEDVQFGKTIVVVTATDADSGNNGIVSYSLSGADMKNFRIDPKTGGISTYTNLDRETTDTYGLTVIATDAGSTPKSSTSSVRITVSDMNDNAPAFTNHFRVNIPENMEVGSFVLRVTSTDKDLGQNAIATYLLTENANGTFSIDRVSGNITLQKPLDAEKNATYILVVSATDGSHDVQTKVEIDISDVNDNSPVLSTPYSFYFEEMLPAGSLVGTLRATDADISPPNNQVYFSLKLASTYFDLDSDIGSIISLEELTFDPTVDLYSLPNRHELVVIVKDLGTPVRSSEKTVYVNIVDYNDHAPVFDHSTYQSAVPETTPVGNSIISVHAVDENDYGDNAKVEYFLTGGNGSALFNVDRFSGIISVSKDLIGNRNREYIVVIKAEDKGSIPRSSSVNVRLVVTGDNQYTPNFIAPASLQITVDENLSVGSLIETFVARDNDVSLNAEVEYQITRGNEDNLFELDRNNGKLTVKGLLDFERSRQYALNITARDKGLIPKQTTISYVVNLRDLNDNDPIFGQTVDTVFVEENSPIGTSVYHAVAVDNDSGNNAVIRYAIVGEPQNKFQIHEITGIVTTKGDLDYETTTKYTLIIMALNPDATHKSTMSLTIYIEGVNEFVPKFEKPEYEFSISESAAPKTSVGQVHATDADNGPDGIVNYFLVGDSNAKGFKIDPRTGIILVSGRPDYESSPSITLQVLAKNWGSVKGNDTDTCVVHISVQDANDPPRFSQDIYQASVTENVGADVSVITVVAEDNDFEPSDRMFSYVILSGNSPALFKINSKTGYISTTGAGSLDRETVSIYNITIGAVDTGTPPETGSAIVQIKLEDVNDNGPQFTNFTARVTEGQVVSTLVTTLTQFTTDLDSPKNQGPFTYRKLSGTHVEYDYFEINESNGEVRTKKVLDREATPEYNIPVIVRDGGTPTMSSTLSFKVMVSDINDNPPTPRFLTIFLSLYNGKRLPGPIADIRPIDLDIDGKPRCTLRSTNRPFTVAPDSCNLLIVEDPANSSYTLEVQGSDGVFDPVSYDISVKVTNFDNGTLDNSIIIQVADITADQFMNKSYTKFTTKVKSLFEPQDDVMVYALMPEASGELLIYVAAKKAGKMEYYSPDILKQKLSDSKNSIQSEAGIFIITIGYSKCVNSQCKNEGKCASHVTVETTNQNADSLRQAFSNPALDLISYCSCKAEFTGPDCSQPAKKCGALYCQNGASCIVDGSRQYCQCTEGWTGASCELDINECSSSICQNGGTCKNTLGSFICLCVDGFSGKTCQDGKNFCKNDPCIRGTCKNVVDAFRCECPYGYWGDLCQNTTVGFSQMSYMMFPALSELNNEIEVVFATQKQRALLLYNPSSLAGSGEFMALEIINGKIRFSVSLGAVEATRINIDMMVNSGQWFKVKVNRNRAMSRVWVEECPEDGGPCIECQIGNSCYGQQQTTNNEKLEVGNHPLLIGGVKTMETILNRTGQVESHDFVGCMRSFIINGEDKLQAQVTEKSGILAECPRKSSADVCDNYECKNGGICVREWERAVCHCTPKYTGDHCEKALEPFQFGADSFVRITMKEDVRRDAQIDTASGQRRRRDIAMSSVLIRFRTRSDGVLLFASTFGGNRISALSVNEGQLMYTVKQYGATSPIIIQSSVTDGNWHNVTVEISASEVVLSLDNETSRTMSVSTFTFSSPDVRELTLGGSSSPVTIDNKNLQSFSGCISVFELDGEQLPMNGTSNKYNIEAKAGVGNGCTSLCANNACDGKNCQNQGEAIVCAISENPESLSIGIIIMIVFFTILLIAIVIVFVVFKQRRKLCLKGKQQKQNGIPLTNSVNSSALSNQDSGYGENNIDKLIINNHIRQELAGSNYQRQNGHLMKPDIIKSDIARTPMPLEMEDGTVIIDNASDLTHLRDLNGEMPELYDIENASSIAPSDIDIADHYRHFHDGGRNRRKNKTNSDHSHHSKHSSRHYQSNHGSSSLHSHQVRDSPNLLTSVPYLNDLARGSPANTRSSPLNQLSRQSPNVRQSPLTHVNMPGHNMPVTDLTGGSRTTSERSLASHRSKNSSSTPNKPKRQMLPNGHPPSSKKLLNHNYENGKFLTLEEVDRLNARPRESPASLMEAFSTSSENNTRKMKKPFEQYQDASVLLEPPESSSDDSVNDSFTCSEFEFENEKPRNDFDPNDRIFSNLTEEDNENEDGAFHNKNFKADGLDSGGNSFSSTERSSDENHDQHKLSSNAFYLDDLMNWGPNYEKLVGVFTDIALLPDASADFAEVEGKSTDREEYV